QVWPRLQVSFAVRLRHRNTQSSQEVRHRRVSRRIRARDIMTPFLQHPGERRHRCAAYPDQVYVFAHLFAALIPAGAADTAASNASCTGSRIVLSTFSVPRTPMGNVKFSRVTCPERSP